MPVLGTGSGRYIGRPLLAIKAPIRALQLPQEQQATGPRWTLSLPQTIILNCHKKNIVQSFCTRGYKWKESLPKFAIFSGDKVLPTWGTSFMGNNFLPPRKLLPGPIPRDTFSYHLLCKYYNILKLISRQACKCFPQVLLHKLDHPWNAKRNIFEDQPTAFAGLF